MIKKARFLTALFISWVMLIGAFTAPVAYLMRGYITPQSLIFSHIYPTNKESNMAINFTVKAVIPKID
jgi:hypothetical protein